MSIIITAARVKELRARSGAGMMECKKALERFGDDILLAHGYLLYAGCAVHIVRRTGETREQARDRWLMAKAQEYKDSQL